jgi:hypothetical protein
MDNDLGVPNPAVSELRHTETLAFLHRNSLLTQFRVEFKFESGY